MNPENVTHTRLQQRLASENPRVVEYRFSDKPDAVFRDRSELFRSRGIPEDLTFFSVKEWGQTNPQHES